jgi:tetratricopeptide (TPR) repeat protein
VGEKLNVKTVLEGSVRKAGNRLRINAQLINTADGYHVWSERYDREMDDVFAVQDEIARSVVDRLKVKLLGSTGAPLVRRSTHSLEAYDLYLKGRFYWDRMPEGPQKAIQFFEQAITYDPAYASAYAGIADSYNTLGWFGVLAPRAAYPKAEGAARKALALDDSIADAHASLGYFAALYAWDWALAERELRRAVELNPNYSRAHLFSVFYFLTQGELAEAAAAADRAVRLDPLSFVSNGVVGQVAWFSREYDRAIEKIRKLLELDAEHPVALWSLGVVQVANGMYEEGIAEITRAVALSPSTQIKAFLGYSYAVAGHRSEAQQILSELTSLPEQQYVAPDNLARICVGLGETDRAFDWLDQGYRDHSGWMAYLLVDPTFDPLRSDSRFQDLLRKMNFPQQA